MRMSGSKDAARASQIAASERRVGPSQDFHVLLRHRLLRQPHGFEALGRVQVEAHLSDKAFVELEHVGNGGVERDSARAAACLQVSEDEHGVVEVADVGGFDTRPHKERASFQNWRSPAGACQIRSVPSTRLDMSEMSCISGCKVVGRAHAPNSPRFQPSMLARTTPTFWLEIRASIWKNACYC